MRSEASDAIRELQRLGIQIELLTGDTAQSAKAVAEGIGVESVSSELLPAQKSARVDELIQSGRTVAMIGDGINDAPALSHAQIGVAMGSGTEVAHASANILLIGNDLRKFVDTLKTGALVPLRHSSELLRHADCGRVRDCVGSLWCYQSASPRSSTYRPS